MPSKIQDLLKGKSDQINYEKIVEEHPWIVKRGVNCIISPDSDGLLSALLMSNYLDWNVIGFYDGKILLIRDGCSCKDDNTVFLDIEIFRENVKSIGHHILNYNQKLLENDKVFGERFTSKFSNCIQPNLLRKYDAKHCFRLKYPFGTVHLLLGILGMGANIDIPIRKEAICPLFFVDGTFNVLYSYPENVLNWLNFLRFNENNNPLRFLFQNDYSVFQLIKDMDSFFRKRDEFSITKERGDRLRISTNKGSFHNIVEDEKGLYYINPEARNRILLFVKLLADLTCWSYIESKWSFSGLKRFKFTKSNFENERKKLNNASFKNLIDMNPLSWAITSNTNLEYTLEEPDLLV